MSTTKSSFGSSSASNTQPVELSDAVKEQLSAWVDGELEANAVQFMQRRVDAESDHTSAIADKWSRYHLAGDVIRSGGTDLVLAGQDFSANVMAAIANEPQESATQDQITSDNAAAGKPAANDSSFWKSGWASLAAMVAVVAVGAAFVIPELSDYGNSTPDLMATAPETDAVTSPADTTAPALTANVRPVLDASSGNVTATPASTNRKPAAISPAEFNDMLLQHNEGNQGQSWLPFARMLQSGANDNGEYDQFAPATDQAGSAQE